MLSDITAYNMHSLLGLGDIATKNDIYYKSFEVTLHSTKHIYIYFEVFLIGLF